jgi:hypothetical protein
MGAPELFDLTGKVAVVTGGSRGIGRAVVEGLAGAGADVVIASRKLDNCEAVAEQVEASTGRRALPVAFHAGHWEDAERLCETVYGELGRCDVLVNNAGISPPYADLLSVTEDLWDKTHAVNARGPFRLSVLVADRMRAAGGGSIINISGPSKAPGRDNLVYAMSKGGLDTLALGLIVTFGPTVRVNTIYPGIIETDMVGNWAGKDEAVARMGLQRLGQPSDFIGTVVFLASDASSHTTGASLSIQ